MQDNKRYGWGTVCALIGAVTIVWALLLIFTPVKAHSAQPYGGCDEAWQAPHSAGAGWCQARGWTVRPNFVLNRYNVVKANRLPACKNEDSIGCYWNATYRGNNRGSSFIVSKKGEVFYVRF